MRWRSLIATVSRRLGVPVAVILISPPVWGADLPPHGPLRILITSDGVNPKGPPPELLVGSGDISEVLSNPKTGLNIDKAPDSIVEIPTNQIELATEALSVSWCDTASYDVLIYFSHRQPNNGTPEDNAARQAAFVAAVESFLEAGGGVVVFHHGLFPGNGKAGILEEFGGSARYSQCFAIRSLLGFPGTGLHISTSVESASQRQKRVERCEFAVS